MRVVDAAHIAYAVATEFAAKWYGVEAEDDWRKLPLNARAAMVVDMNKLLEMDQPWCGDDLGDTLVAMVAKALKPYVTGRLTMEPLH